MTDECRQRRFFLGRSWSATNPRTITFLHEVYRQLQGYRLMTSTDQAKAFTYPIDVERIARVLRKHTGLQNISPTDAHSFWKAISARAWTAATEVLIAMWKDGQPENAITDEACRLFQAMTPDLRRGSTLFLIEDARCFYHLEKAASARIKPQDKDDP